MRLRQRSAGVPAGRSRSRSRTPDHYTCLAPRCRIDSSADGRRPRNCDDLASATHPAPFNAGARLAFSPLRPRSDTTARSSTVPTPELNRRRERCHSAPCSVYGAFDPVAGVATRAAAHRLGRRGSHHRAGRLRLSGCCRCSDRSGVTTSFASSISRARSSESSRGRLLLPISGSSEHD